MIINAVIVEDSRLARNELKELIKDFSNINLIGEAQDADEGILLIKNTKPDLLFLDINMPEKDGFQMLEELDEVPMVIFTTAYNEYAVKSFEYNALDYLMKPINKKRFKSAVDKVSKKIASRTISELQTQKLSENSQIFIKEGEDCWLVKLYEITLFEIVGNYTRVYFQNNKPLLYKSLNQIEEKLPNTYFFRANRQQIINTNHIVNITPWFNGKLKLEMKQGINVEISRRQSQNFKKLLSI
ncbi:DNA-binding response regulator [Tenacibaculum sp. 190524A02b]|uniref:LytR/AlgR family response regulator transcription factor n=1 Tax=Tenacibaculum vairaonense TaxID=3137860 RepID=UPI0032B2E02F